MGSYTISKPRGLPIDAAADMASPGAIIKAKKFDTKERKTLSKKKLAEPDGSFPIRNKKDLSNAKKDIGRAGNKASDRAWINKRAKDLHAPGLNAGGPGSGRHQDFHVNTPEEVDEKHKELLKKGFKYQDNGTYKNEYGRTANIFMKKRIAAGGPGSGRHPEFDKMHSVLVSKGFKPSGIPNGDLNNLKPEHKMVEYHAKGKFPGDTKNTSHRITVATNGKSSPYTGDNAWQHRAKLGSTSYINTVGRGASANSLASHLKDFKGK